MVHYLDGQVLLQDVAANPSAYGITKGLVCPIFPDPTCVVNSSGYLFYGDALHLTSQGFAIVAQYIATQLAAPLTLQAPSDLGFDTARQWGRTLSSRSRPLRRVAGPRRACACTSSATLSRTNVAAIDETAAFEIKGVGATFGAEYGLPSGVVGDRRQLQQARASASATTAARIDGHSWQIGAYGSMSIPAASSARPILGYGKDNNQHHPRPAWSTT